MGITLQLNKLLSTYQTAENADVGFFFFFLSFQEAKWITFRKENDK